MSEASPSTRSFRLIVLLLGFWAGAANAQAADGAGRRIVDVVAELRDAGLTIIYSEETLTASMRVRETPTADEPLERLREMLALHGLALERGPRGSWLVVRLEIPAAVEPAPAADVPELVIRPPALESVVVSASRYASRRATTASTRVLSREELESSPTLGRDALRATHDLPGVTSSGLTARMHVRGGGLDEVLLRLDGVRLFDPFHLKDFQNLFSSIDPAILESMEVRTGAYPAEYGDRMSGVVDMRSVSPAEPRRHEIGVSTLQSSVLSSGVFAEGRGEWVTSVRRGNLDLLVDAADSDLGQPQYVDFYNKLSYAVTPRWTVSTGALALDDKISLSDGDVARAGADYDDRYLWLRAEQDTGDGLRAGYVVSTARISASRNGSIDDPDRSIGRLSDSRHYDNDALEADWSYDLSARHQLEWGMRLARARARYDFESQRQLPFPIRVVDLGGVSAPPSSAHIVLAGEHHEAYLSYRARATDSLTSEVGLRWDRQTYTGESQLSPRLGLLLDVGERTSLRASWGRFHQSQGLDELQVADGVERLYPAQRAEHVVLSVERLVGENVALRFEAYRKEFEQLKPRFENLLARVSLLPELLPDRVLIGPSSAESLGLELSLDGGRGPWTWWLNLSRSSIEDSLSSGSAKRSWDESWAIKGGTEWAGPRWTVTLGGTLRSGWPVTSLGLVGGELTAGPYNATRFPTYRTLDVRASRRVHLERGTLRWFVEVDNLLDRQNPCCIDYGVEEAEGGSIAKLELENDYWLGTVPTIGFSFTF